MTIDLREGRLTLADDPALLAYRGSIAHGMYVPGSNPKGVDDVDLIGMVLPGADHYLGLHPWAYSGTREVKDGHWDVVLYEFHKLVRLLLRGNPNVLSLLWLDPEMYIHVNDAGRTLLAHRGLFVGKHVYREFAGYAAAQLAKMTSRDPVDLRMYMAITLELKIRGAHPNHKGVHHPVPDGYYYPETTGVDKDVQKWSTEKLLQGLAKYQRKGENIGYLGDKRKQLVVEHGYDTKNAAHCIRLLRMAEEFLTTGMMTVNRRTAGDAEELLSIKTGQWSLSDVQALAEDLFQRVKSARTRSTIPDGPAEHEVNDLVVNILRDHLEDAY